MLIRKIIVLLIVVICANGCAGPTMHLKDNANTNLRPMGLFICVSTQILDYKDTVHNKFVINIATKVLVDLLKDKFDIMPLNGKIQHDEVFNKYPFSFYIDEKKIAKIAGQEGCKSCLIVYYAATNAAENLGLFSILTALDELKDNNGMNLYTNFSLYGWMISTEDADIISKSHSILSPFKYLQDKGNKEKLLEDYVAYLTGITQEMFLPIAE